MVPESVHILMTPFALYAPQDTTETLRHRMEELRAEVAPEPRRIRLGRLFRLGGLGARPRPPKPLYA